MTRLPAHTRVIIRSGAYAGRLGTTAGYAANGLIYVSVDPLPGADRTGSGGTFLFDPRGVYREGSR